MHFTFGTHTMRTLQDIKALLSLIETYFSEFFSIQVTAYVQTGLIVFSFSFA